MILHLNRDLGITFLISSHILTELALVATRYGIISRGKLLREVSAAELENVSLQTTEIKTPDKDALFALLSSNFDNMKISLLDGGVRINGDIDLNEVLGKIINANIKITSVNTHRSSIEDYYLSMTGGGHNA
jgi:ABC-2 type transport system ATP-binding protein